MGHQVATTVSTRYTAIPVVGAVPKGSCWSSWIFNIEHFDSGWGRRSCIFLHREQVHERTLHHEWRAHTVSLLLRRLVATFSSSSGFYHLFFIFSVIRNTGDRRCDQHHQQQLTERSTAAQQRRVRQQHRNQPTSSVRILQNISVYLSTYVAKTDGCCFSVCHDLFINNSSNT